MKSFSFFVAGIPKGQPRPKAFARNMGGGKWAARVYDPGTAEHWKSQIAVAAKEATIDNGTRCVAGPVPTFEGPILLRVECFFPRPKSHFRSSGALKESAPSYVCTKPDFDNCAKAVADALTQLGFWRDDSQVCAHVFVKRYVLPADQEHNAFCGAHIEIRELGVEQVETERLLEE
jgi:Holliday junction resolvase RusA-like endonuclease